MTDMERILSSELDADRRRNEGLQAELFNLTVENKKLAAEASRWRQCAIAAQQQLEAIQKGESCESQ